MSSVEGNCRSPQCWRPRLNEELGKWSCKNRTESECIASYRRGTRRKALEHAISTATLVGSIWGWQMAGCYRNIFCRYVEYMWYNERASRLIWAGCSWPKLALPTRSAKVAQSVPVTAAQLGGGETVFAPSAPVSSRVLLSPNQWSWIVVLYCWRRSISPFPADIVNSSIGRREWDGSYPGESISFAVVDIVHGTYRLELLFAGKTKQHDTGQL